MITKMMSGCSNLNTPKMQAQKKMEAEHEQRFQARLSHVIAHENAHASAAGRFGGAPVINADRHSGQVSGYVPIKMDFGKTADEALANARVIFGAAMAPGDPSGPDKSIAASAMSIGNALAASRRPQEKANPQKPPVPFGSTAQTGNTPATGRPPKIDPMQNPFTKQYRKP